MMIEVEGDQIVGAKLVFNVHRQWPHSADSSGRALQTYMCVPGMDNEISSPVMCSVTPLLEGSAGLPSDRLGPFVS
jgi:hypothetical protein